MNSPTFADMLFLATNVLLAVCLLICELLYWRSIRHLDYAWAILASAIVAGLWVFAQASLLFYAVFDPQTDAEFRLWVRHVNRPITTLTLGLMVSHVIARRRGAK